jgi:hypothetical protein
VGRGIYLVVLSKLFGASHRGKTDSSLVGAVSHSPAWSIHCLPSIGWGITMRGHCCAQLTITSSCRQDLFLKRNSCVCPPQPHPSHTSRIMVKIPRQLESTLPRAVCFALYRALDLLIPVPTASHRRGRINRLCVFFCRSSDLSRVLFAASKSYCTLKVRLCDHSNPCCNL